MSATAKDGLVKNLTIHEPNKHVVRFHLFLKKCICLQKNDNFKSYIKNKMGWEGCFGFHSPKGGCDDDGNGYGDGGVNDPVQL